MMSRITRKTSEVLEEGKASRETWTPKLGSAPLRVYRWWLRETNKYVWQENFCHFWRVVLIWAPLLRVRKLMRLDKQPSMPGFIPRMSSSALDKWLTAWLVFMLLVVLGIPTVKLWGDLSWWSLIVGPLSVVVGFALVIGVVLGLAFVVDGVVRMIKRRRAPRIQGIARRVQSAGRSGGEFVVLTAQVIRVKKWKVCPLVEIPPES